MASQTPTAVRNCSPASSAIHRKVVDAFGGIEQGPRDGQLADCRATGLREGPGTVEVEETQCGAASGSARDGQCSGHRQGPRDRAAGEQNQLPQSGARSCPVPTLHGRCRDARCLGERDFELPRVQANQRRSNQAEADSQEHGGGLDGFEGMKRVGDGEQVTGSSFPAVAS